MNYTLDQFTQVCGRNPEKMLGVAHDLGFNDKDFKEAIWDVSPGRCRLFFGELVGHPFDYCDKEKLSRLFDLIRSPNVLAKVLFFLQDHQNTVVADKMDAKRTRLRGWQVRKQRYEELTAAVAAMPLPDPELLLKPSHSLNFFQRGSRPWLIFEIIIRFEGTTKQWLPYLKRCWKVYFLNRGERKKWQEKRYEADNMYFKRRLRMHGMSWIDLMGIAAEKKNG